MARVYAIASAKGGVGKTTTTANLGATLAETGADVVVIDGDIGMANLGAALGIRPHGATLHDALGGSAEPETAAYEGPAGLSVVPGDTSLDAFSAADPQQLQRVVDAFDSADYVLIDVGAGVSHETSVPLSVADAVVLVSTPERDALVDTEKTRQLTDRLGGVVAGAVLTRTDEGAPIEEIISGTLNAEVLTTIPEDEAVRESIAVGEPLVSYAPHSDAAAGYRQLAIELTGIDPTPPEPRQPDPTQSESGQQSPPSPERSVADSNPADSQLSTAASEADTDRSDTVTDDQTQSDADHNVVNPFAATPKDETTPADQPDDDISKWAEAATGTVGDADTDDISIDPEIGDDVGSEDGSDDISIDPAPTERDTDDSEAISIDPTVGGTDSDTDDSEAISIDPADAGEDDSIPRDAIPFGDRESTDADSGPDEEADEESAQTTVLGEAIDEENAHDDPETDSQDADATAEDDDGPLIPDAEETAANARTEADETDEDEAADEDDEEKRGFFSRLFGG